MSVHIRIVGDWTTAFARRLGCSFDDEQQFWIEELRSRTFGGEEPVTGGGIVSGSSSAMATDSMAFGSGASLSSAKSRSSMYFVNHLFYLLSVFASTEVQGTRPTHSRI